jgi:hypothetical protein
MTAATDTHATMEELLEMVFSVGFVLRLYSILVAETDCSTDEQTRQE